MFISPSDTMNLSECMVNRYSESALNNGAVRPDAPSGYGRMYDQLFQANPYEGQTYKKSWWQSLLSSMGFRTKEDDFNEQMALNSAEYDSGIFQMMMQNEFNDPSAMASRERSAGLNPDFLGIGDVASSASPYQDPEGPQLPQTTEFNPMDTVYQFAKNGFSVVTSALSIMKDFSSLKNLNFINEGLELDNAGKATSVIYDTILKTSSPDSPPDPSKLSGALDIALGELFPDEKSRKRYSNLSQQIASGLPVDLENWKKWRERAETKVGYARTAGQEGYDEGVGEFMMSFFGALESLRTGLEELQAEWQSKKWNDEIAYLDVHDPTLEGLAQNEQYEADIAVAKYNKQQADMSRLLNSVFDDWTKSLKASADRGSVSAQIGLALIGVVRLIALSGLSYSGNSSQSRNPSTGFSRESSGFSIGF